jgi:nucleotide-binding universal stress UspA family protein
MVSRIIPAIEPKTIKREIVIISISNATLHAFDWALESYFQTDTISNMKIILESCIPKSKSYGNSEPHFEVASIKEDYDLIIKKRYEDCCNVLRKADFMIKEKYGDEVEIELVVTYGNAGKELVKYAKLVHATRIIVGSGKVKKSLLGKIKHRVLGSMSDYCVKNAKCPVTVILQ